jgi:hypothetical protein
MKTTDAKPKKRWSRRKTALLVTVLVIGALAAAGYIAKRSLTGPAVGTIITTMPASTRQQQVELEQFDGTQISFVHPQTYIEQVSKPVPGELEHHIFVSSGMVSKVLTVVVTPLPSGKLEDNASYYMRAQNSAKYHVKTTVVKNEKVVIFSSNDGQQFQQTGFWPHAGKLLTFTMSGVASDMPGMTAEYQDMMTSISWR